MADVAPLSRGVTVRGLGYVMGWSVADEGYSISVTAVQKERWTLVIVMVYGNHWMILGKLNMRIVAE